MPKPHHIDPLQALKVLAEDLYELCQRGQNIPDDIKKELIALQIMAECVVRNWLIDEKPYQRHKDDTPFF